MKITKLFGIAATLGCIYSQTVDTGILGTVIDATGAVVPEASITITQPDSRFTRTITTSAAGKYEIRYLVPGEYTTEVKASGFRSERQTGIVLQVGQQARIDYSLQVGEVVEAVEVTAAPPLLQTQSSTLGEVVSSERIV